MCVLNILLIISSILKISYLKIVLGATVGTSHLYDIEVSGFSKLNSFVE